MIYRQPPFGSLSVFQKMRAIPDPTYTISFPAESIPIEKSSVPNTPPKRLDNLTRYVCAEAISTMKRCLVRASKERAVIPALVDDIWLTAETSPPAKKADVPVPNPFTNDRMAYVDDHYMKEVIKWTLANAEKAAQDMDGTAHVRTPCSNLLNLLLTRAQALVNELRNVYLFNAPQDQNAPDAPS